MELREFRVALGLRLQDVATAVDSDKASIWRLERNKNSPRAALREKVAEWAERERKRRRLPSSYRLTWAYLLREPRCAPDRRKLRRAR
jgi:transcriptional regulator with XRE-family HTH domain